VAHTTDKPFKVRSDVPMGLATWAEAAGALEPRREAL